MSVLEEVSESMAAAVARGGAAVARLEGRCSAASAVVFGGDGLLVTAAHTLEGREVVDVALGDGRTLSAKVLGHDRGADLAVLKVDATDLSAPEWADTASVKVGHLVLTLGRPGRSARATLGMVSAVGEGYRTMAGASIDRYIEVDGSLPRGFSGGALADTAGRLLGMNTAGLGRGGGTIPTETLRRMVPELAAHGKIGRGYLGVEVVPGRVSEGLVEAVGQRRGLLVAALEPGGPGESGGLLLGDLLLGVDGQRVERPGDLVAVLGGRVRATVTVRLIRAGDPKELTLTTGAR
ncbi:MAG: trypsin-like peptidase domain-containing protein [Deltaproteobacteria bacterium]|nr:trypsin-like peptidase domain-containing protein [Myxococcales bacterium]MDP3217992.1 trypsin-like peptidase domain-containing protein [Deltaproteobacteria bacterium]